MASIIKADNIQKVSDGSNIIKKCGSTITLGSCGATIALACGATQTGFGQTYSATEFCTTVKTAPFTAVAGKGYFVNTTCAAVTVTLPASPTAGDVVSFKDYAGTFNTNNLTLCRNGNKIGGTCNNDINNTAYSSTSIIYVDATQGWLSLQSSASSIGAPIYIVATGGTITTCGDYKIHTFTADGCFAVTTAPTPANNNVDYLVVAGGGGSEGSAGGGGAGGFRESHSNPVSGVYTASPLATTTYLSVSTQTYPVTVGAGGATGPSNPGSNSVFSTITSTGGGGGASQNIVGNPGGSGSGPGRDSNSPGGSGNTPPTSPPQGNPGGSGTATAYSGGGGGGGAGAPGQSGGGGSSGGGEYSGNGGNGVGTGINACAGAPGPSPTLGYYSGGGGGGNATGSPRAINTNCSPTPGRTGRGGYGGGANANAPDNSPPTAGVANTGGGAGAGCGGTGGSGIVIIRYKYQ